MHLTPDQLERAARKLCELRKMEPDSTLGETSLQAFSARLIEHVLKTKKDYIAAIIHAVATTQQKDEVSE